MIKENSMKTTSNAKRKARNGRGEGWAAYAENQSINPETPSAPDMEFTREEKGKIARRMGKRVLG
jgi:hypothetical protein